MRKFLLTVVMVVITMTVSAQTFTELTVKVDRSILDKQGHVQIILPRVASPGIPYYSAEYFIDVYSDGSVSAYATAAPSITYTVYSRDAITIEIRNIVSSSTGYHIIGNVFGSEIESRWYLDTNIIDPNDAYAIYPLYGATLEVCL